MALDVQLLRESFELVLERQPELTPRFYEIFFSRYPQVRKMFGRNSGKAQSDMLAQALMAVIDHLEDASWLNRTLRALGAKHVAYGVTPPMYAWVGECLLMTLAEAAGDAWTPKLAQAWYDAYNAIAGIMLAGAADAEFEMLIERFSAPRAHRPSLEVEMIIEKPGNTLRRSAEMAAIRRSAEIAVVRRSGEMAARRSGEMRTLRNRIDSLPPS